MPRAAPTDPCPCGRTSPRPLGAKKPPQPIAFAACCAPLLQGSQPAANAEALMRSRYTAYALGDAAYVLRTWHPSTRPAEMALDASTHWLGLQVQQHNVLDATHAEVAFVARYKMHGRAHRLQEHSRFVLENGQWFYVDAVA